ncbi:hypothetical protein GCM10010430_28520 [Kitasatospora cystarginea]|uniref:Uncharacterized protein n=1 Tax=Kitasatospora cystarginea TaxID=58350 RepID=A0ABP5QUS4_9ACTN
MSDGLVEESGTAIDQGIDRLRVSLAHCTVPERLDILADRLPGAARHLAHRVDDVALLLTARPTGPAADARAGLPGRPRPEA